MRVNFGKMDNDISHNINNSNGGNDSINKEDETTINKLKQMLYDELEKPIILKS